MDWYFWLILLIAYPFIYKEPNPGGYLHGIGAALVFIACWGLAIALAVGIAIGRLT